MARPVKLAASDLVAINLVLVPYLLERQEVPVAEAAAHFGVTEAQMRSMVEGLTLIGLPGERDFYQMPNDLFDINWDLLDQGIIEITNHPALERPPRLTSREAAALIAGLELIAAAPGVTETQTLKDLRAKLARGASGEVAEVSIDPGNAGAEHETLLEAIRSGRTVSFDYRALDATPTTRTLTPHRVLFDDGQWYVQGWCHLRRAQRTFNLERMSNIALGAAAETPDPAGADATDAADAATHPDYTVTLRVREGALELLGAYLREAEWERESDGYLVRVPVASPQALKRIVSRNAGALQILAPQAAVQAAADWAAAALSAYTNS